MIYSLKGIIAHIEPNIAIIECNNIGYKCNVSGNTMLNLKLGEICCLYTHMVVKEDSISLFGFYTKDELEYFKILVGISGIGPKAAISILSQFTPQSLTIAVSSNDYKAITKCQGIGLKTAQRIILELKDKIDCSTIDVFHSDSSKQHYNNQSAVAEALAALKTLGYSEQDVLKIISKYESSLNVEDIIKMALKEL